MNVSTVLHNSLFWALVCALKTRLLVLYILVLLWVWLIWIIIIRIFLTFLSLLLFPISTLLGSGLTFVPRVAIFQLLWESRRCLGAAHLLPLGGAAVFATLCAKGRGMARNSMGEAASATSPEWKSSVTYLVTDCISEDVDCCWEGHGILSDLLVKRIFCQDSLMAFSLI